MVNRIEAQLALIASRIRELRTVLGITAEDMAEKLNITTDAYLFAESGKSDFSFSFVHNCAKIFGVDITELITGEGARLSTYSIVRSGEGMPLERRLGFSYSHLASNFKGRLSEPFMVRATCSADESAPIALSSHEGEEFDYVLSGTLKINIAGHEDYLYPGDAVYYNSSEPHGMVASGGGDCVFLAVVTDALGRASEYSGEIIQTDTKHSRNIVYNRNIRASEEDGILRRIEFTDTDKYNFAFDTVDEIAHRTPDKKALVHLSSDKTLTEYTFGDLSRLSSQAAFYFESLGIKKGDRVMVTLKRNRQFWIITLALHKLGAVMIPATNLLMKKDFEYRFNAGEVSAFICTADGGTALEAEAALPACKTVRVLVSVNGSIPGWHDFDREFTSFPDRFERRPDTPCGNDPMLMFFTSGTTGYPKLAVHSYTYPLGHFITAKYWHRAESDGLHLTIADTGWGKAFWGKIYGQWLCGSAVFAYDFDKFSASDILPLISQYKITTFCAPPTMFRFFIREDLSKYDLSSLKYATVAGEALNPEVYEQFLKATGLHLTEGFGQTETTLTVANLPGTAIKVGSMGLPSPMYDVDIVNADGESVENGETGEIVLRLGDKKQVGLFLGYYNDKNSTDAVMHDGLYHTGDTAWRDEDGYFWYVGRTDDLIKSSGYRIGPFEIESVIMELPYVLECAVTAVPDEIRGQIVKATIVTVAGFTPTDETKKEIQTYVKSRTAPYKYPRIVEFCSELPKTISGKIRRNVIRAGHGEH